MNLDQAKQYLDTLGVEIPDFMISAIIERIDSKKECLSKNYSENTVLLIYCYLIALIAGAQSGKYISNQSISGALSRSFTYKDSRDLFNSQLSLLKDLDTEGCVSELIPESPFSRKKGFMMSVRGGCYE